MKRTEAPGPTGSSAISGSAPELQGDALDAVAYRGGHLQIIAGAGKTEVVAQRVASLLAEGVEPSAIVAFTFTERAAASHKARIELRAADRIGHDVLDRMNRMFVGTIHSYRSRDAPARRGILVFDEDGRLLRAEIRLEPENRDFEPIILMPEDDADVQVLAVFQEVLVAPGQAALDVVTPA